jgi:hypothetical protein
MACGVTEPVSPSEPVASSEPVATEPARDDAPLTPEELDRRHRSLREELRGLVGELSRAGRYDCCIEHPCNTCAMRMGGCKCGHGLRNGEPVCEECAMMWRAGQGDEPGVDPASVRSFLEAEREAQEAARAAKPAAACSCPGHVKR